MKKWILILTAVFVFQKWDTIMSYIHPPEPYNGPHGDKVVLYATEWCGYCAKARAYLKEKNIPYVEFDIEKSPDGRAEYDKLGGTGVPLLVVRGNLVRGYSPQQIEQYLQAN